MGKPYHNRDTLERLYCDEGLTQSEIADRFDVTQSLISKWLRKTGVVEPQETPWQDEDTLRELYHEKGLDQSEIADKLDIASNTVSAWMSKHDIATRPHQDAPHKNEDILRYLYHDERLSMREIGKRFGKSRETVRHWLDKHGIERRDPNHDRYVISESDLKDAYLDDEMTLSECAEKFGCSARTVAHRLDTLGVERRNNSDSMRLLNGEYAPYTLSSAGYSRWHDQIAGAEVYVHQLTAIAHGAPPEKVFTEGCHIHHRNTIRWDNRPQNVELVTEDTHMATHQNGEWIERNGYPELKTVAPKGQA